MTRSLLLLACAGALCCAGCTYYVPATTVPVTQTVTQPANFDRSFNAALGAMQDQGLTIQRSDASGGVIVGMDVAIAIRTGIVQNNTLYVQAAAGVVADSVPEMEWKETEVKARALLRAAELVEEGLE